MFGLGFGAPTPSGEQAPVLPGFEGFLTEADAGLEFVSGAPPGPEPPPGEPLPLEEAEELEPNAQPQKLDFQPNLTEKIEVELPEPFWNKGSFSREEPESQSDAPQSDVSVQWLASRLTEGFFQNPVAVVQVDAKPVSPSAATPAVQQKPGQPVISAPTKEFPTSNSVPVAPPNLVPAAPVEGPATTKIDSKSPSTPVTSTENPDPEPNVSQTDDSLGIAPEVIQSPKPQLDSETLAALKPTAIETHSSLVTEVEAGYKEPIIPVAFNPEVQAAKPVMQKGKPVELPKATDTKDSVFTDVPKSDLPESTTLDDSPQVGPENRAPKTSTTGKYEKSESPELPKSEPKKANKGEMSLDVPTKQTQPEFNRFQVALSTDRHSTENALQVEPSRESVPESKLVEVVRQVSDKVRLLAAARPKSGVTIHLDPEEFGSITVVVRSIGRMVDASLSVSDDRVRDALDRHQSRLVEAMDNHGFVLQNVLVNSQPSGGFQPGSRGGQESPSDQPRHFGQSPSHGRGDRPFKPPKSNIRAWVRRGEGVDISI